MPRLLSQNDKKTKGRKRARVTILEQRLKLFKRDLKEFLHRFVTVDETKIHSYTTKTKEQSKQWTAPGEPALKVAILKL